MNRILSQVSDSDAGGFVRVALPIRHMDLFDYRCDSLESARVGCRAVVPFGRGTRLGIIVEQQHESTVEPDKIKSISAVVEPEPAIDADLLRTLQWTSQYYHQPFGEVLWAALPKAIRIGKSMQPNVELGYSLTEKGCNLNRATFRVHVFSEQSLRFLKTPMVRLAGNSCIKPAAVGKAHFDN